VLRLMRVAAQGDVAGMKDMNSLSTELHEIADRLQRLAPSHRDPFKFHEDKSELVNQLRRLAACKESLPTAANDNTKRRTA